MESMQSLFAQFRNMSTILRVQPSTRQNGFGIATVADFGAESSRPGFLAV
jgi:hypothetical protein